VQTVYYHRLKLLSDYNFSTLVDLNYGINSQIDLEQCSFREYWNDINGILGAHAFTRPVHLEFD